MAIFAGEYERRVQTIQSGKVVIVLLNNQKLFTGCFWIAKCCADSGSRSLFGTFIQRERGSWHEQGRRYRSIFSGWLGFDLGGEGGHYGNSGLASRQEQDERQNAQQ